MTVHHQGKAGISLAEVLRLLKRAASQQKIVELELLAMLRKSLKPEFHSICDDYDLHLHGQKVDYSKVYDGQYVESVISVARISVQLKTIRAFPLDAPVHRFRFLPYPGENK